MHALKKRSRNIDPNQRDAIFIQLLQGFNATSTATFALGGVDHLPGLVMAQLYAIFRIVKVEKNRHQDREAAKVFEDYDEGPSTQQKGGPFPEPFDCEE